MLPIPKASKQSRFSFAFSLPKYLKTEEWRTPFSKWLTSHFLKSTDMNYRQARPAPRAQGEREASGYSLMLAPV